MTIITEKPRRFGFVSSVANGYRSYKDGVVDATSGALYPGSVLGRITSTGKYVPYNEGASDGSQVAVAILTTSVDAGISDATRVLLFRDAIVDGAELTYTGTEETVNAGLSAVGIFAIGLASGGDTPVVTTPMLAVNRLNVPGHNGYGFSDGVDQNSNSRIAVNNQSGATMNSVRGVWSNWRATVDNETSGLNDITITASIEYPSGTFNQVTFDAGSTSKTIAIDGNVASDDIALSTPIPDGAKFWINTYVSVSPGGSWPLQYLIRSTVGADRQEAADFNTGVDLTMTGGIVNASPSSTRRGFGPISVLGVDYDGVPRSHSFASVGDSVLMYAGDGSVDSIGSQGWNGRALAGRYPHINFAISGSEGRKNTSVDFTRRRAALALCGVTDILCDYSHNDLGASETLLELQTTLADIWGMFDTDGYTVHHTTSLPRTTGTFLTAAGQTISTAGGGNFQGGTGSVRHAFNEWIRTTPSPIAGFVEISDAVDVDTGNLFSSGAGYWISGNAGVGETSIHLTTNGSSTDQATADGTHPVNVSDLGGQFILRDTFDAYLDTI